MSKLKFDNNHFLRNIGSGDSRIAVFDAVEMANAKLAEWRKEAIEIRFKRDENGHIFFPPQLKDYTHRALLIDIEELPKKCLMHEPDYYRIGCNTYVGATYLPAVCKHCGVKLVAEWREAE